ncbi:MAG: ABC transporter permease [Candidatus Bathyarchaeota archaeon]|nr:ABC transporter permease [Candidatus Bathyarchaeota archaeon]MDH5532138.1 ABC transporter permease [Candidatus Bathyarchaeota archaeon]
MSFVRRVAVILGYEWRRALAKKWVLALIVLAIVFQTLILVALAQFIGTVLEVEFDTIWVIGVLQGQGLFVPLIAIIIAGGSMSEEYERGTADILLSKPITKVEYITGKFLGGFSVLCLVEGITTATGVVLSLGLFGPQSELQVAPVLFLAIAYSSLVFFSLSFMFSEVFRRGTLAMFTAFGIFIASSVVSGILSMLYVLTGEQLYEYISKGLPTWSTTNFAQFVVSQLIGTLQSPLQPISSGDFQLAAAIIAVYAGASIVIALVRLVKSDVSKKAD